MRTLLIQVADVNRQCVLRQCTLLPRGSSLAGERSKAVPEDAEQTTFRGVTLACRSRDAEPTTMPVAGSMSQGEMRHGLAGLIRMVLTYSGFICRAE